jgi:zinc transport system ATP-binding protein
MSLVIEITDVDFAYDGQPVLCGVSLGVEAGSTVGVIGPNGGGKTTLLKLLLGLLVPARGQLRVGGLSPRAAVRRGDVIGYLPQQQPTATALPLSIRQLVRTGLAGKTGLLRPSAADDLAFVDDLIRRVGLDAVAARPVRACSGGQLQRAMIARALAARPKVLLLDEPTTGVDARGQRAFVELIAGIKADLGLTIVFVSHDLRAVTAISDRVACLNQHLHYHDTPRDLPAKVAYDLFACDLAAMGIGDPHHTCGVHAGKDHNGDTENTEIGAATAS